LPSPLVQCGSLPLVAGGRQLAPPLLDGVGLLHVSQVPTVTYTMLAVGRPSILTSRNHPGVVEHELLKVGRREFREPFQILQDVDRCILEGVLGLVWDDAGLANGDLEGARAALVVDLGELFPRQRLGWR
jgi:hypothetical protein